MHSSDNNIDVPHLNITISESDNSESILKTIRDLRPKWDTAKVKMKLLTDGITNKLVLCTSPMENGSEEQLLIRIYGHKTDLLIDRKAEIRNIKLLHSYNLAPTLYATFNNGLIYEFIPGNTLTADDVVRPEIYKQVAKELARMHKVKMGHNQKPLPCLWTKLQQFIDLVPEEFDDAKKQKKFSSLNFSKEQLLQEIRQVKEAVSDLDIPIVFAHNDLLLGNIIYNDSKKKVFFIDFEYANFNFQPYDIGNHFAEFAGVTDLDFSRFPKKDFQLDWIRTYLKEFKDVPSVSEYEVEVLYVQVNKFVLMTHLFWYSWALIQAAFSHIDFDYIEYGAIRIKEYFKQKTQMLSLQLPESPSS